MPAKGRRRGTEKRTPSEAGSEGESPRSQQPLPIIKVVGISGSGKSTLVRALRAAGYDARAAARLTNRPHRSLVAGSPELD